MVAHVGNPRIKTRRGVKHHGDQVRREFDVDVVEVQHVAKGPRPHGFLKHRCNGRGPAGNAMGPARQKRQRHSRRHEGQKGHPGHDGKDRHEGRNRAQCPRMPPQLVKERHIRRPRLPAPRQQKRRRDRGDHRRNLADQTVADRQDGIGFKGMAHIHAVHHGADKKPHDDVQHRDEQPRNGVALDELRRPVERAEEVRFGQFLLSPPFRLGMVDGPGSHVAVDRQLLARHAVQRETRADLGHAARALGDDDEVDDQQDAEHHHAQHHVAAHDEAREPLDHRTGSIGAGMALPDDELCRGHVQRQTQQQRRQQDRGKGREFQRAFDEQRDRQHQDGQRERQGQPDVQHGRGDGQDHHHDDSHQRQGEKDRRPEDGAQVDLHRKPSTRGPDSDPSTMIGPPLRTGGAAAASDSLRSGSAAGPAAAASLCRATRRST